MKLTLEEFESLDFVGLAAVSMKTALKYRRKWNKEAPSVKMLQEMMPNIAGQKKGYRLYLERGHRRTHYTIPPSVRSAVKREGYVITDYLAKKCVKAADAEQKNQYNIGKVIAKYPQAKTAFDNDPVLQNSKSDQILVVVSCHPYDVIGMSTGRDWDQYSCMRLDDGVVNVGDEGGYNSHVEHDVAEGTMVAYAIRGDDKNINDPLCRCLIKPFLNKDGNVLFRRENDVYGNNVPGFMAILGQFLRQFNANVPEGLYYLNDKLYNDGIGNTHEHRKIDANDLTLTDVMEDQNVLMPYIQQELNKGTEDSEHKIAEIFSLRRNLTFHDTEINEIVDALKDHPSIVLKLFESLDGARLSSNQADLFRRFNFDVDKTLFENDEDLSDASVSTLANYAALGSKIALEKGLSRVEKPRPGGRGRESLFFKNILSGLVPLPDAKTLRKYPKTMQELGCFAQLAKHMPLFDENNYENFVYAFQDLNLKEFDPVKIHKSKVFTWAEDTQGSKLRCCAILEGIDTYGNIAAKTISGQEAFLLSKRRPWRALMKIDSPKALIYQNALRYKIFDMVAAGDYGPNDFRDIYPDIIKFMTENPKLLGDMGHRAARLWHVSLDIFKSYITPVSVYRDSLLDILGDMMDEVHALNKYPNPIVQSDDPNMVMLFRFIKFIEQYADDKIMSQFLDVEPATVGEINKWLRSIRAKTQKTARKPAHQLTIMDLIDVISGNTHDLDFFDNEELRNLDPVNALLNIDYRNIVKHEDEIFNMVAKFEKRFDVIRSFRNVVEHITTEAYTDPMHTFTRRMSRGRIDIGTPEYNKEFAEFVARLRDDLELSYVALRVCKRISAIVGNYKTKFKDEMSVKDKMGESHKVYMRRLQRELEVGIKNAEEVQAVYPAFIAQA